MRTLSRTLARLVAAAALAAAAGVALPTTPASAATCSSADGVSVVVDFHELGGGVRTACVADGGGQAASSLFPAAGFALSYVQRQPGFVCRVSGAPADDPCVNTPPADAYWGLWWSNGTSGSWTYASTGAGGLNVPDGGYVAFSWNGSSTRSMPGVTPAKHPVAPPSTPAPTPTHEPSSPSSHPTHTGSADQPPASPGGTGSASPPGSSATPSDAPGSSQDGRPGTKKSDKPDGSESVSPDEPVATATASEPTDEMAPAAADVTDPGGGGLPTWVAPIVIAVLFAGAGGAAVVRRRRGTPGP